MGLGGSGIGWEEQDRSAHTHWGGGFLRTEGRGCESPEGMSRHKWGQSSLYPGPVLPTLAAPRKAGLGERGLFLTS